MKKIGLLLGLLIPMLAWAQVPTPINMQNGTFTTCNAYFYDSGGPSPTAAQYQNNENYTITFCPNNATYVSLNFFNFDLGTGDIMTIYNGNSTAAPVLAVYDNTSIPTLVASQAAGNPSGCLTISFVSDAADTALGWSAEVNCFIPCQSYDVVIDSISHDTANGAIQICQDDTLQIWAHGDYFENNTWYSQSNGTVSFNWYIGGDEDSIINQQVMSYPIDSAFGTKILVTAVDSMGCASSNPFELTALVSTTPDFTNVGLGADTICFGETNLLSLDVETTEWSNSDSGFIAGTLALPDGSAGAPGVYASSLTFSMFTPGDTVATLSDIIDVWVDIEHSFLGDLSITMSCPNGSNAVLKAFPGGGGNWLGEACDAGVNSLNVPGNGYLYEWPTTNPGTGILVNATTVNVNDFCNPAFTGNTKPAGQYETVTPLTNLIGCPLNGTWSMTIVDQWAADDGTLFGWGINFDSTLYPSYVITYEPSVDTIIVDMDTSIVSTVAVNGDTIEILPNIYDTLLDVTVSVIDDFGCSYDTTYSFFVRPPYDPVCCKAVEPITQMIKVGCPGGSDGQIIADPVDSLGPPPFWYTWYDASGNVIQQTDSVFTNDTLTGLAIGTYTVEVKDSIGCIVSKDVTVTQVTPMQIVTYGYTQTSCAGAYCDAQANSVVYNGTSPYSYLWSSGDSNQLATQLCAGNQFLQVIDGRGCIDTAYFTINSPAPIQADALGDSLICISNGAPLTAVGSGGTPPYTYTWQGGASTNQVYTPTPGISTVYQVVISDANNCPPDSATAIIQVRPPLTSQTLFVDTICPYDTASLKVIPQGGDSIYSYAWSDGSNTQTITASPNNSQYYYVTITDACGTQPSHEDSVWVQVGGYPALEARTIGDDTICLGEAYNLLVSGRGGDQQYTYEWDNGLGLGQLKSVVPTQTTAYFVTVTDNCNTPAGVGKITVHVGNFSDFSVLVDSTQKCDPGTFYFSADSILPGATYEWNFGNGYSSAYPLDTFDVTLTDDGCNDVSLRVTTELGCETTKHFPCIVEVLPTPNADFTFDPLYPNVEEPTVNFAGNTFGGEQWVWTINGDTVNHDQFFYYHFPDSGQYFVNMHVTNEFGCSDSLEKPLFVYYTPTVFIPTAFTPNGDNLNDSFGIIGEGISDEEFRMQIFNRWGNLVFETTDITEEWNGQWNNSGEDAENGTYVYVIYYKLYTGLEQVKRGEINIIR